MPTNRVKAGQTGNPMDKKTAGYCFVLLNILGSVLTGLMGLAFVVLAVYLVWTDIKAGRFTVKSLMMPTMNVLISSVLFFYCHRLFVRAGLLKKQVAAGSFSPPDLQPTTSDLLAIFGFVAVVALICLLIF